MKPVFKRKRTSLLLASIALILFFGLSIEEDGEFGNERDQLVRDDVSAASQAEDENDVEIESEESEMDDDLNMPEGEDGSESSEELIIHKGKKADSQTRAMLQIW